MSAVRTAHRVLVPLAPGFEDLEAVTIIDVLRRAGIEVVAAGTVGGTLTGSRGMRIIPDMSLDDALQQEFDMVALPGGLPGSDNLAADQRILKLLKAMNESGKFVGAVCAAPKVLVRSGILNGREATAYPGVLQAENHPRISTEAVICDGRIITSRSAGTAMDFALSLVEALAGEKARETVEKGLVRTPG